MSIGVTTSETFELTLSRFRGLPAAERPVLIFRHMTGRQRIALEQAFESAKELSNDRYVQQMYDLLRAQLAGWRNFAVDFDAAKFEDVTRYEDVLDIKRRWSVAAMGLDDDDEKKSS